MVPLSSHGIPRVPRYFGSCSLARLFEYTTLTFFGMPSHTFLLKLAQLIAVLNPEEISFLGLASSAFARHYSRNLG